MSAAVDKFEDLVAWQKARVLAKTVYDVTSRGELGRDFALRNQMRRAAVSVVSNIAEGFERGGNKEFHQFLILAKASAGEVRAQAYIALDARLLTRTQFEELVGLSSEVSRLLSGLMRHLKQSELKGSRYVAPSGTVREARQDDPNPLPEFEDWEDDDRDIDALNSKL